MSWVEVRHRLLIVPGLHGSGPDHWQSWLERLYPGAVRLNWNRWSEPNLDTWSQAIHDTLSRARQPQHPVAKDPRIVEPSAHWHACSKQAPPEVWLAVGHSFGCLALVHYLLQGGNGLDAALLVAPAHPDRFDIPEGLLSRKLSIPSTLVSSTTDPWMPAADSEHYARRWDAKLLPAGPLGHINVDSGHGAWPLGRQLVGEHFRALEDLAQHRFSELATARPALRFAT